MPNRIMTTLLLRWVMACAIASSAAGREAGAAPDRTSAAKDSPSSSHRANPASLPEDATLFASRYGESAFPERAAFHDGRKNASVRIAWSFYLLREGARVTLIDAGFSNPEWVKRWALESFVEPTQLLRSLSVDPEQVARVIITHLHFDHLNELPRFPNARVVISRRDRDDYLTGKSNTGTVYDETVAAILRDTARTHVVDTAEALEDGVVFEVVGGHTAGSSVVHLHRRGVDYVLTGDECYLRANAIEKRSIGVAFDRNRNAAFLGRMLDPDIVLLPCHDPVIFQSYSRVSANVVRIFP